jgi:hypothetical protein
VTRRLLDPTGDFAALFPSIKASSWRWECQGDYQVDGAALHRWRNGLAFQESEAGHSWLAYIRDLRSRGIPFERVRMITDPVTDYLRWMVSITDRNIEAGEDIRWLHQAVAVDLGMPDYDFYVFDDDRVVILHFDDAKVLTGEELIDEPDVVAQHREFRDRVWHHAVQHRDFHL